MQKSFRWWQCSERYIISLFPPLHTPLPPFFPSLISLVVSVDVMHHVYLLTYQSTGRLHRTKQCKTSLFVFAGSLSCFFCHPQWGTADAEINVPCDDKCSPFKAWSRNTDTHGSPTIWIFFLLLISTFPVHSRSFIFFFFFPNRLHTFKCVACFG